MSLGMIDLGVVGIYAVALFAIAIWVSREPAGHAKDTEDYFLAGRALPWWAIGASLIASNISAEQIIGQSGQGFVVGLAIAAYEWQAAIVLLVVAKFFLPIFLKRQIYTMPQFLETRYGAGVKSLMSVYWIALYTAVNLTAVLWLGGLAIESLTGLDVFYAMCGLAAFAVIYSLYGGLKAVALTDIIQVVILIAGGLAVTWIALDLVSGGHGPMAGFARLGEEVPGHFRMILDKDNPSYSDLPGIWTLLGGLWVLHFSYWGFNQYIIQRALGAENLAEAQKGLALAAFLKLLIPLIVVVPGIAALILAQDGVLSAQTLSEKPDRTYGTLMTLAPEGLRGLVFAALVAAIVSSLASMMNSISTIFTMDIYRDYIAREKGEKHYVLVGRVAALTAMAAALFLARPFLGGMESAFQTIQEYSGFIAPGVVAIFLLGFFFKPANQSGAFAVLIGSVLVSLAMKLGLPDMPFVLRIWIVFLAIMGLGVLVSLVTAPPEPGQPVALDGIKFHTQPGFNFAAILVMAVLVTIYAVYW
ncbi:MAG: sodium/solute symporter [Alphaproteobacteria bacterium]|nr:sodium/solute symporter [Alphaproteobacteria bacterium]